MELALIGLGGIAEKAYMPLLATWPDLSLLAHSRNPETVQAWLERYPFRRGTADLEELIDWAPRAALVLSPSATHFEIADRLLRAGIDVYVEKPLTLSSDESGRLAALAKEQGRILMVGFNRRFAPLHEKAKRLWGQRQVAHCVFQKHRPQPLHTSLDSNYTDDVIHQIDLARFLCGEATALDTRYRMEQGMVTGAVSNLKLDSGGLGVIATSRRAGRWHESYEIHGQGASMFITAFVHLRWIDAEGERVSSADDFGSWTPQLELRGFKGELEHFLDCVARRTDPLTSAEDSVLTQRLTEQLINGAVRLEG